MYIMKHYKQITTYVLSFDSNPVGFSVRLRVSGLRCQQLLIVSIYSILGIQHRLHWCRQPWSTATRARLHPMSSSIAIVTSISKWSLHSTELNNWRRATGTKQNFAESLHGRVGPMEYFAIYRKNSKMSMLFHFPHARIPEQAKKGHFTL